MKLHKLGFILLGLGIAVILFALVSDSIGFGKKGVQAAQLLLIMCGILLSVMTDLSLKILVKSRIF